MKYSLLFNISKARYFLFLSVLLDQSFDICLYIFFRNAKSDERKTNRSIITTTALPSTHLAKADASSKEEIEKLKNPMIYNYIDDNMPEWAREAVQAAVDKGALKGEGGGLGLTYADLRTIVREYRMGMYNW